MGLVQPKTDEEGKTAIDLEGTGRRNSLLGWATPVKKTAKVQLTFAAKPPNMRQDLIDTLAAGGLLSNPITLLTTVPVEMILRSRWFASPVFTVPVKDWEACGGGWSGTITYTETLHNEQSGPNTSTTSHSHTFDRSKTVDVTLNGNPEPNAEGLSHGTSSLTSRQTDVDQGTLVQHDLNGRDCSGWEKDTNTAQASGGGPLDVAVSPTFPGKYYIGIIGQVPNGTGEDKQSVAYYWPCAVAPPVRPDLRFTEDAGFPPFEATADPKSPDELIGSTSGRDPVSGREWKTQWSLHSCSRVANVCSQ